MHGSYLLAPPFVCPVCFQLCSSLLCCLTSTLDLLCCPYTCSWKRTVLDKILARSQRCGFDLLRILPECYLVARPSLSTGRMGGPQRSSLVEWCLKLPHTLATLRACPGGVGLGLLSLGCGACHAPACSPPICCCPCICSIFSRPFVVVVQVAFCAHLTYERIPVVDAFCSFRSRSSFLRRR